MRYIAGPTAAITSVTSQRLGGKAAALASLQQAGFPVPEWFALLPDAFEASLVFTDRDRLAAACRAGDDDAVAAILSQLQPPDDVRDELAQALNALSPDGSPIAVRSSASDEDGAAHSFAGQLASYLNVAPGDVAAHVADVWRSGFAPRILAYRRTHGLGAVPPAPAVLLQRMVVADAAGVAFSADPASGRRGIVVVSAVAGLGESLVSGASDADTATVDRLGFIERVHQVRDAPLLSDDRLREIAGLARRCEQHFGVPQDIEWALAGGKLALLQSRPITTLAALRDPDGAYALWDNSNIAESYGGVTTPLTFSFARHAYEEVYRELCRLLGVSEAEIAAHADTFRRMIGLVRGRIYYSLFSWYDLLALAPGFSANRRFMEQMMGVKEELPPALATRLASGSSRMRLRDALKLGWAVARLVRHYRRLPRDIEHFYARLNAALTPGAIPLEQMRPDELVAHYRDLEGKLLAHWDAPLVNDLFAMLFYGLLRRLCAAWCGDTAGTLQNDLVSGQGGIISAEPARRVRSLALLAAQSSELVSVLRTGTPDAVQREIARQPAFAAAYADYLAQFADRCLEELKLESPTLRDDPTPLLRAIGHLADRFASDDEAPMSESVAGQETPTKRALAERKVRRMLAWHPLRRALFGFVLAQARARVRDRENLRFERTRVFGRVRRIVVELGHRFSSLGLLEQPRDIFYLEIEEALGFVMGTATTTNLKGLVAVRAAEYATWRATEPPPDRFETRGLVPIGSFAARLLPADESPTSESADQRSGIGCCPGVVRGYARVVSDPKTAEVRAGEILVAERTDPGWILLFAGAAGVVVERGSVLSHSAIVSRELGLPAVVSVPGVTTWLSTGDLIEVNGTSGVVTRITAPPLPTTQPPREATHAQS